MAGFSLTKVPKPGEWRVIGLRAHGVDFSRIPIAGMSIDVLQHAVGGSAFEIKRVKRTNAFVLKKGCIRLLYVRPSYTAYRKTASKVFAPCRWNVDFDHVLGRSLARALGYEYTLIARVLPSVNRAHGRYERPRPQPERPSVCFADSRIADKLINRGPKFIDRPNMPGNFNAHHSQRFGLTLKQAGKFGFSIGMEDALGDYRNLVAL